MEAHFWAGQLQPVGKLKPTSLAPDRVVLMNLQLVPLQQTG